MTLKELSEYRSICAEIKEINAEIKSEMVHNTVRGSDKAFPYLSHAIQISGLPNSKNSRDLLEKVHRLETQKRNIEFFVENIEDSITRRIFRLRFIKGLSWRQIAFRVGGSNSAANVKMICYRYLRKKK